MRNNLVIKLQVLLLCRSFLVFKILADSISNTFDILIAFKSTGRLVELVTEINFHQPSVFYNKFWYKIVPGYDFGTLFR